MANPTNKSYDGIITWATGSSNDIQAKNLITARNIKLTNSSNTQLATASFNGTADATLKLAATVPISISGNADTATTATNSTYSKVTNFTNDIWYCPVGVPTNATSGGNASLYKAVNPMIQFMLKASNYCYLRLGDPSASNPVSGRIRLYYREYGRYTDLCTLAANDNYTVYLPNKGGTIALTSDIPSASVSAVNKVETTSYRCDEVKFSNGFMIKYVYYKSTSVPATPSSNETITFGQAFTAQAAALQFNFSTGGSAYIVGATSLNSNRPFGCFWHVGQEGYSSAGANGMLTKTNYTCNKSNPQAIAIICGY